MEQTITKTGRSGPRGKVLEFRDNLIPARASNYANVHGRGGTDSLELTGENESRAPNSTVKVLLADKEKHQECTAGLEPETIRLLYEVCLDRILHEGGTEGDAILVSAYEGLKNLLAGKSLGDTVTVDELIPLGKLLRQAVDLSCGSRDFSYEQVRVHRHRTDSEGLAPVYGIRIVREETRNGQVQTLPWQFSLSCGRARPAESGVGYVKETMTDVRKSDFKLSDMEMYGQMSQVKLFIDMFEKAECVPVVQDGERLRNEICERRRKEQ